MVLTVFAVITLIALMPSLTVQAEQCVYKPNTNITAEDMVPAAFSVSTYDCCATCWKTKRCVAAVYSNYMCHLKGVALPTAASSTATVVFAELPSTPVPPTPQPTTPAPPPPPPPSTTPSPLPTDSPPMTPTPGSANGSVILYRSMMCDPLVNTCRPDRCPTKIYFSGECYGKKRYTCLPNSQQLQEQWYNSPKCEGHVMMSELPVDTCSQNVNKELVGTYCDYATPAVSGVEVTISSCGVYDCGSPECTQTIQITGQCNAGSDGNSSTLYNCWPDAARDDPSFGSSGYITISSFSTSNCSGTPSMSALPIDVCYSDTNSQWYMNTCGNH